MHSASALAALLLASPALAGDPAPALAAPPAPQVAAEPPRCTLNLRAELDMDIDDSGRITVPISINGVGKRMMVDTGSPSSLISRAVVEEMKLKFGFAADGRYLAGFGGSLLLFVAHLDEFRLGKLTKSNFNLFVLPDAMEMAGILGADFLGGFDVDLDFARAKLNLITPKNCSEGGSVYWTNKPYGIIPFEIDGEHILVKVLLDGREIRAVLDTGAVDTVMSLDRASKTFDLDERELSKSRHYPFKTLTIGEVSVGKPAIMLMTDRETQIMGNRDDDLHMIIGMGVLRRLHLYVSYSEKKIYVTPATQY
jgi:predicted aspartyl protease